MIRNYTPHPISLSSSDASLVDDEARDIVFLAPFLGCAVEEVEGV